MRGYSCIGLDHPKFDMNVGGALRACFNYDANMVAVSGNRFKQEPTDTPHAWKSIPLLRCNDLFDVMPYDCVPVAVDLVPHARNLFNYIHPPRAFYIFGAEDATLGERIISRCRDVIYIPTKSCMNLAATVNVVLYDRMMKGTKNEGK